MFTKTGPGVVHNRLSWFLSLDRVDRVYAVKFGWVPAPWLGLPVTKKRQWHKIMDARTDVASTDPQKPGEGLIKRAVKKVWGGIKRFFGGRGEL